MKKIDKRLCARTPSFNKFFACVLICNEDLDICWQGNGIKEEQFVKKVLKVWLLKTPMRPEIITENGTWRQTCEAFRNRFNSSFLIFPEFRIRLRISRSWHFFNVAFNLPNKLVIRLDNMKKKENRRKEYILSLEQSTLYAERYTIIRCWMMSETDFKKVS